MEVLKPSAPRTGIGKARGRMNRPGTIFSPSGRGLRRLLFAACALLLGVIQVNAQSEPFSEYQVKAAFLYTFTKFVEWPPEVFSDSSAPIVLGIFGHDPFGSLLTEIVADKTVNGRKVIVKRFKEGQDLRSCHILFVSVSEKKHLPQILGDLKESGVLTVSEMEGFAQSGGMIGFVLEKNKVKLEINLEASTRARLKMSAKMLAVARIVAEDQRGGKS
jgi:hypothetical protein